jgi:hypothetical protein
VAPPGVRANRGDEDRSPISGAWHGCGILYVGDDPVEATVAIREFLEAFFGAASDANGKIELEQSLDNHATGEPGGAEHEYRCVSHRRKNLAICGVAGRIGTF